MIKTNLPELHDTNLKVLKDLKHEIAEQQPKCTIQH